jgi:uncharacterized protein involved in exopolysaccharide biosynthesis
METLTHQVLPEGERALTPTVRDVLAIGYRPPRDRALAPTVRDIVAIGFRHRKLLTLSFFAVLLAVVLPAVLMPKYEAEMKILVKHERVDPVITPEEQQPNVQQQPVSEEELNSEVELLRSDDLLKKVVVSCGLDQKIHGLFGHETPEMKTAKAVRALKKQLHIDAMRKTDLINVSYASGDPDQAAKVLSTLASAYMEKHLAVHRPSGQFDFFKQQADQYAKSLAEAEAQLAKFPQQSSGVVSAQAERDSTLQNLAQFQATLATTQSAIRETRDRITKLESQIATTPARITTSVRTAQNPTLMQQLKATLLQLQLKRTALLDKYTPEYRGVQEVDREIADTKAALDREEAKPMQDVTTDQDPTHLWMREELAKAQADLKTLQAREAATQNIIAQYRGQAEKLNAQQISQGDLLRAAKINEDNYLLYRKKAEEARITDALDQRRIMNVSLAEEPSAPLLPTHSAWFYLFVGGILAATVSAGLVFARDYLDTSFRTPDDVRLFLDTPVLAALPKPSR